MTEEPSTLGWGITTQEGVEIWDTNPIFSGETITFKDRLMLLFYPKKWFLYRFIERDFAKHKTPNAQYKILDVGCGMGATVVDFKKMFGRRAQVVGVDVVNMQVDLGNKKIKQHGVAAELQWYDGMSLPFHSDSFDAIYTSDVLGHVEDVSAWLSELHRVLKPGGVLSMFSESKVGRHAWMRRYLLARGLNTDPHAQYHISLFDKEELKSKIAHAGFDIKRMYSSFWLKFLCHPDELYPALQKSKKFFVLRTLNKWLYAIKKRLHPYYAAVAELYGLVEMYTLGRWVESQGYVILARKKK